MKRILTYQLYEAQAQAQAPNKLTKRQENFLNRNLENKWNSQPGTWTLNPQTGLVDVDGDFYGSKKKLKDFKGIRFGRVSGSFYCGENELTSLEGAPLQVGGDFGCSYNPIGSLVGAPQEVGGYFACIKNNLSSLEGAPQKVGKWFTCEVNNLTSLIGGPQEVGTDYDCNINPLTSLKGAPLKLGGRFSSDLLRVNEGEWNTENLLKLLSKGDPKVNSLILSFIFSPVENFLPVEVLNAKIAKDPVKMIMLLRPLWNEREFRDTRSKLIWPKGYGQEADLVGDLGGIGF
jgi:hypothetical protein